MCSACIKLSREQVRWRELAIEWGAAEPQNPTEMCAGSRWSAAVNPRPELLQRLAEAVVTKSARTADQIRQAARESHDRQKDRGALTCGARRLRRRQLAGRTGARGRLAAVAVDDHAPGVD